ncbi:beta-galactosidase 13-like [Vigna unguiculata]|uniref:beta-galactosidase 13-like n=1 Tax=Vigna unguiculata TaxID=3917 RepID=UPI0010168A39|nr:beta-galactosidase 13-like [Vigna unguiculata]
MSTMKLALITLLFIAVSPTFASGAEEEKKDPKGVDRGPKEITYDSRSLIINGKRELLFSGSVHYPRSPPEMWPHIIDKARRGGINVIQTYIFWNIHEPVKGKFKVDPEYDFVKFIQLCQDKGMYVTLRIGPFIQAEWNHGGLPYWLREVPGIIFRSNNDGFKTLMQNYVNTVIKMCTDAKLFGPQGGPIILAQIENEYNHIQRAYKEDGDKYVQWAANLAVSTNVGVPWIMCKQTDAPDPVINACNGRHCGDTFTGPNKPYKPFLWTENWTAQYRVFGDPPSQRSAEDIAFSVARFFSKNGSLVNYYMYYGGTNFGRTSSGFSTTRYYDEAPLDEFGLQREPKWTHLRDVHKALSLCRQALFGAESVITKINQHHETIVFEKKDSHLCTAFITNNHTKNAATIRFRDTDYFLPPRSISILPDCKTVVFNTQNIASQHNSRNFKKAKDSNNFNWEVFTESIPDAKDIPVSLNVPIELYKLVKDTTDYAWYTTSVQLGPEDLPTKNDISTVLRVLCLGHSLHAFVNGEYIGSNHGTHEEKTFVFQKTVTFKVGVNSIAFLGNIIGLPDSGAYMEHRYAGPKSIFILGLNSGKIDLTRNGWGTKVGIQGEEYAVFTEEGSKKVQWQPVQGTGKLLSWYKTTFTTPEGKDPVAIRMTGMGKGIIWVNGKSIGRHWMSFLSPLGTPTQSEYHIPRTYLNPKDNLLVIFEEEQANPNQIEIVTVERDTVCSIITENHPPNVNSWAAKAGKFQAVVEKPWPTATVTCPVYKTIKAVEFASFGDPTGFCGEFVMGKCDAPATKQIIEQQCMGKNTCSIPLEAQTFTQGKDPCPDLSKTLAIQVKCAF